MHFILKIILKSEAAHNQYAIEHILRDSGNRVRLFSVCHRQAVNLLHQLSGNPQDERITHQNKHKETGIQLPYIICIDDNSHGISHKHNQCLI